MPLSLRDQVVLIVGGSSGIGRESAIAFAREGAHVLVSARRENRLNELHLIAGIKTAVADASKRGDMARLAEQAQSAYGRVDVLVYAAGTNTPDRALARMNASLWDEILAVNLNGAYYITEAVLPGMRARKHGDLIYISSISGLVPDVSGAAYQASKRGLNGLAHAIRVEEKEHGIRTCVLCPGLVDTEILEKRPVKPSPEMLGKAMRPEDVAEVVVSIAKLPLRATMPEVQLLPTYL